MNKNLLGKICLLVVSISYGFSYAFQDMLSDVISPFNTSLVRYAVGAICLFPFALKKDKTHHFNYLKSGLFVGLILAIGSYTSQLSCKYAPAGKVGFIVSMYILFVPVINYVLFKKKINILTIVSIIGSIIGLFILCDITTFSISITDFIPVITALCYAVQIVYVDRCVEGMDAVKFTFYEFIGSIFFSIIGILCFESFEFKAYSQAIFPLAYIGLISGALAYTLQSFGQKYTDNTLASMIMSLESVFSIIGGYLILNEQLTTFQYVGCAIMFVSVLICIKANK